MKKIVRLELDGCNNISELHKRIKKTLGFPKHYGENLDSFWDCLSYECDVDFITLIGINSVSADLKDTIEQIIELLEENKQKWKNSAKPFDYEIIS